MNKTMASVVSIALFGAANVHAQVVINWDGEGANTLVKTAENWEGNVFPSVGDTGKIGGDFVVGFNNRADFDNRTWEFSGNSRLDGSAAPGINPRFKTGSMTFSDNAQFINIDVYEPDGDTSITLNPGTLMKVDVRFSPRPNRTNNVINIQGGTFDVASRWDNTTGLATVNLSSGELVGHREGGFRNGFLLEGADRINFTGDKTGVIRFIGADYSNNYENSTDGGTTFFRVDFEALITGGFIQIDGVDTTAADLSSFSIVYTGAPGDFNNDGAVDAADYTVWQDNLGLAPTALNGNGSGAETVVQEDYGLWLDNFGSIGLQNTVLMYIGGGEGALAGAASVPEPAGAALLVLVAAGWPLRRAFVRRRDVWYSGARSAH